MSIPERIFIFHPPRARGLGGITHKWSIEEVAVSIGAQSKNK